MDDETSFTMNKTIPFSQFFKKMKEMIDEIAKIVYHIKYEIIIPGRFL